MFKKIFILFFTVFCAATCAFGADYTVKKLPSGQTVIVKQVSKNPIVTIDTWVKTGSINEDDETSGVAHFLEHLFFKGTEKNPSGTFDKILESKGGVTNAATSKDFTHYYIIIPSKDFDLALDLHSDMLMHPLIPRKELEKERLVVLEEISKNKDSPYSVMSGNLFRVLYEKDKHPYMREIIGDSKVIETITRDEILDYYNKFYTPDKMTTVIVGDVDPQYAVKKTEEFFQTPPAKGKKVQLKYPKTTPLEKQLRVSENKDVGSAYMMIGYRIPKFGDNKDVYALDVLSVILGESSSSRLNQSLKEQKEIVYSISSSAGNLMEDGIFIVQANFDPNKLNMVENEIYKEIDFIKNGEFTDMEVLKAKNMIKSDTYYSRESISNISNELGYLATYSGGTSFYDNYLGNIDKVQKADVIRVAKQYLLKDKNVVSLVLPKGFKDETGVIKPAKNPSVSSVIEQNKDVIKYKLECGPTLIIKKNKVNSIVAVDIQALGGNFIEKIPSTSYLAASVAMDGTKSYNNKELAQILDEKGIKLGLSSGNDTFKISMQTTVDELKSAFDLLNEVVNYPTFSQNDIEKAENLKLAAIKSLKDNSLSLGMDNFRAQAFQNSIYGYNSKTIENNIGRVTRNDILSYYNTILEPQNLTVAVVGDVDDKEIIDLINNVFCTRKIGKKLDIKQFAHENFKPQKNLEEIVPKEDSETAWILLGYKTTSIFEERDLVTLKVINAILGEGMSSRLFTHLRDNQGLAYMVGSVNLQNALDGVFMAYIGTNPAKIDKAKKGIMNEFETLKTQYVTQKELQEAKDKILGNLLISLETNMDDASLMSWYGAMGHDINHLEKYKALIQDISTSDILSVANKYFAKPYILTIVKH